MAAGITDTISVELHAVDGDYFSNIVYTAHNVALLTNGTATATIPPAFNGSYYITIRSRNHLATVSANAVSFAGSTITQSFGSPSDVYDGNLRLSGNYYVIYGGDVNQDFVVDAGDISPVGNAAATGNAYGYLPEDINGDGSVDAADISIVGNNAALGLVIGYPGE